jgi:thioredoxin 1
LNYRDNTVQHVLYLRNQTFLLLLTLILITTPFACSRPDTDPNASRLASFPLEKALANGKPTLAEFGWRECIPCKAMRPILEELDVEYKGKLNVLIVEIPFNEDLAEKYSIKVMPVQIFFDGKGKEVARHAGFLPKEQIIPQLEQLGVTR